MACALLDRSTVYRLLCAGSRGLSSVGARPLCSLLCLGLLACGNISTAHTCAGPRAYVGLAYAYHKEVTKDFQRLADEDWNARMNGLGEAPEEVPWLRDVIAP